MRVALSTGDGAQITPGPGPRPSGPAQPRAALWRRPGPATALAAGLTVLLFARVVLSVTEIGHPGLQQDETLFVNAATLRLPGVYLLHSFHGLPLMVFPYIGALKSWIYAPVFSVFGTTAASIRVPAVLIVCLGLVLAYRAVSDVAGRATAVLAFVWLCFDNSVFWLTRDDVGPSALEFTLKCALIYAAARLLVTRRARWIPAILLTLALGVFNKLNFIWIVNDAALISVIWAVFAWRPRHAAWRPFAVWVAGLVVIYGAFAFYYESQGIGGLVSSASSSGLGQPWALFANGSSEILSGTWFYDYALRPGGTRTVIVYLILIAFAAGTILSLVSTRRRNPAIAAVALVTVVTAAQTLLTAQATAGWHYIAVYPFVVIVAAYGLVSLAELVAPRASVRVGVVAALCAALLIYNGALLNTYFSALDRAPLNSAWTPAIYNLDREVTRFPGRVYSADWGIYNPLFALHQSDRLTELAFAMTGTPTASLPALGASVIAAPGPKLLITHPKQALVFPNVDENLAVAFRGHLRLVRVIREAGNVPVYDVYQII